MMQRLTNRLYHSTLHRVMNNLSGRDRYSVATFYNPDYYYRVECLPSCLPESGVPDYPLCTLGEHIQQMFERTYSK
jgi:isopenicillin N synthase-like dioxygenase